MQILVVLVWLEWLAMFGKNFSLLFLFFGLAFQEGIMLGFIISSSLCKKHPILYYIKYIKTHRAIHHQPMTRFMIMA